MAKKKTEEPTSALHQMAAAPSVQRMQLYQVVEGAQEQLGISNVGDLLTLFRLLVANLPEILAAGEQISAWIDKLVAIWNGVGTVPTE